jgi:hypothetical protein
VLIRGIRGVFVVLYSLKLLSYWGNEALLFAHEPEIPRILCLGAGENESSAPKVLLAHFMPMARFIG